MSEIERALERLARPQAVLAPCGKKGFGVFAKGDRRRRPAARLSAEDVRRLEAEGALAAQAGVYVLSEAGRARVARNAACEEEAYLVQHGAIVPRVAMNRDGRVRAVRGLDPAPGLRRIAALTDAHGAPWFCEAELAAARALRSDWERAQLGLVRGSDWRAPPKGAGPRADAEERAMAARCDARRRFEDALRRLAPGLRVLVERVCLHDEGLEAVERRSGWPPRSAKVALKLALAQLAAGAA